MHTICNICGRVESAGKALANHINSEHKITTEEYTIRTIYDSIRPVCKICQAPTRYVAFGFKQYCKKHSITASSEGGKIGGKIKHTWNKDQTKKTNTKIAELALTLSGANNHFYGKVHTKDTIKRIRSKKLLAEEEFLRRINSRKEEFLVYTPYSEYQSRQRQKLICKCLKCGLEQKKTLLAFERGSLCIKCFPFTTSRAEIELGSFLREHNINIIRNDRELISPKELDVYIPEKKIAIEYNGLFWHKNDKALHIQKTLACKAKGVKLIHVFSDEWSNKQDLIKSMLLSRLGLSPYKVDARNCVSKEIKDKQIIKDFFNRTHISGHTAFNIAFGLYNKSDDTLVAAISCRRPFLRKKYGNTVLEIARFSSELEHNVRGAFGKLLKSCIDWAERNDYCKIISYCDLRFGTGNVYEKTGFTMVKENTGTNYWYSNGRERFNRFKFRALKNKTENEVAKENGVFRVYGCGNALYEFNLV